jgi:hypothetical protein
MGVLASLKVHKHGTLYHDIPISPHLVTTLEDVNWFGTFLPLGMGRGGGWNKGSIETWNFINKKIKPRGTKIQNATKVATYLKSEANKIHAAHPHAWQHINKFFYEMKVGDIDKNKTYECETVC